LKNNKVVLEVLKHYNLGKLNNFEVLSGGYVNGVIKIETNKGSFVLKIYEKKWLTKQRLEEIAKTLFDLKSKINFPVPKPIKNNNDEFILDIGNNFYEVTEFIEGEEYSSDFKVEKMINAAKVLAQLHKETQIKAKKDYKPICFQTGHIERLWDSNKGYNKNYTCVVDRIAKKKHISNFDKLIIEEFIPFVKEQLKLLNKNLKSVRKKPNLSKIHNDYWGGQLIFDGDDVAAVIDFELMVADYAEYDLVKSAQAFAHHLPKKKSEFDFDRLKQFLSAYKEVFGKVDLEPEEVLAYLRHSILGQIGYWIETLEETQNEKTINEGHIYFPINKLKWVTANEKEFVKWFCE